MVIKIILAMVAFAANSVLCRLALKGGHIDAVSFSSIRLISGAFALWLLLRLSRTDKKPAFKCLDALLLFVYVFAFSIAYISIGTGPGALLLFGTVQLVMTAWGMYRGERLNRYKLVGMFAALAGILILLLPGAQAPSLSAALIMVISGVAWALYSINGKNVADAAAATAGNFILAAPVAAVVMLLAHNRLYVDDHGLMLGVVSGAVTSGAAYMLWYTLLPRLRQTTASTIQLSVPCLATLGGVAFMDEALSSRIILSTIIILAGIGVVIWSDNRARA